MPVERRLGICHMLATVQYFFSAAVVILWILLQTGLHWSIVFSLSTQGFAVVALAAMIYGFATYRGAVGDRRSAEHPFTSSLSYRFLYLLVPVLSGLVGAVDFWLVVGAWYGVLGLSVGTVLAATVMWLLVDPIAGLIESAFPQSRLLRAQRLAREQERRERRRREKQLILEKILAARKAALEQMRPAIEEHARRLRELLLESAEDPWQGSEEGARIGLATWQLGGAPVMKQLYATTARLCSDSAQADLVSYLDYWWDGVGEWRRGHGREALAAA
jgi:hypothetical protein